MKILNYIYLILLICLFLSCSKQEVKKSVIKEKIISQIKGQFEKLRFWQGSRLLIQKPTVAMGGHVISCVSSHWLKASHVILVHVT